MLDIYRRFEDDFSLLDRKALFAMVYAAAGLSCIFYLRNPEYLSLLLQNTRFAEFGSFVAYSADNNFPSLAWWVAVVTVFYVVLPMLAVKFLFRRPLSDFGLKLGIESGFLKLLLQCVAIMLPLVYLMSLTSGFSAKYPFLHIYDGTPYLGWTFVCWELIYFVQFFGLEFFFRGFLLHSLKPSLGPYAIFVMTVPYCMIHFGKPMPETFAAIFAGVFLGWLSFKNGNIWMGLVLHCTVALSMDVLALYNKGLLF
jgi:membrane protease YdiL (CAAX protease family)